MRRLAAIDWLLLGTSLPIFLIGVVMSVVCGVRGDFVVAPFYATSAADEQSYPVVAFSSPSAEANPLAVGDRLLRLEGSDLRGVSNAGFLLRWCHAAQAGARSLLLTIERGSVRSDVRVLLVPGLYFPPGNPPWWGPLPAAVSLGGTALLLLLRAAHWHLARRYYVASLLLAFFFTPYFTAPTSLSGEFIGDLLVLPLANWLLLWNLNEFLPGLRLWGPGQRAVAWALAFLQSASMAAMFWLPNAGFAATSMYGLAWLGFAIAFLVALTRVYRRADPRGRRQIKWVVYGFYVALLPLGLYNAAFSLSVVPEWISALMTVAAISPVAMSLGFLVAVAFYQFLDIDRLFSATLSYSILAILGLAMVLGVMPAASRVASDALGLDPAIGQLLISLGLAAVLVPAHRIVRPWIDRWLFPERATLEQGFAQLLGEISRTADMQELTELMVERLDALLRPAVVVLYARAGDLFTPVVARGRSAPPPFAARSALIAALQERTTPLAAQRWTARWATSLTPFERAAIETLDVAVLVPIRRGAELAAFWCLGAKRSGDIYTPTDLALLGAVAGAISDRPLGLGETRSIAPAEDQPPPSPLLGKRLSINARQTLRQAQGERNSSLKLNPQPLVLSLSKHCLRENRQSRKEGEGSAAADDACVFRQEGEYWTLAYRGETARLRDTKGLHYIARLLAQPGRDLHVRDLATLNQQSDAGNGSGLGVEGDLGTILDARATAQYKERLAEARQELDEATAAGDLGQAARARHEIESITEQLAAAYGLGGRPRTAGDPAERVRKAVSNQIRRALDRIGDAHPELGRHLTNALRTGFVCVYRPEQPVAWRL